MLFKLLEILVGYVKETPAWPVLRPVAALVSLYVTALVLVYQLVEWQYRLSPSLSLFMRSYLVKQVTVVCIALALVVVLLQRLHGRPVWSTLVAIACVVAAAGAVFSWLAPRSVANVRVKFLAPPETDQYAMAYVLYELNRAQRQWFFEVDFEVFNENALTAGERARCDGPDRTLCLAELSAQGRPFIGITTEPLEDDFFWKSRGPVSVVSTHEWKRYAPPSEYEFLTHAIIVLSIVVHLNAHCEGLPAGSFRESRVSVNDLFQFTPRRHAMKAAILATHLNRSGELLLFNCFGPEYVSVASNLLTLDWLRSGRVRDNLERAFRIKVLSRPAAAGA